MPFPLPHCFHFSLLGSLHVSPLYSQLFPLHHSLGSCPRSRPGFCLSFLQIISLSVCSEPRPWTSTGPGGGMERLESRGTGCVRLHPFYKELEGKRRTRQCRHVNIRILFNICVSIIIMSENTSALSPLKVSGICTDMPDIHWICTL